MLSVVWTTELNEEAWERHEKVLTNATKFMQRIPPVVEKPFLFDKVVDLRGACCSVECNLSICAALLSLDCCFVGSTGRVIGSGRQAKQLDLTLQDGTVMSFTTKTARKTRLWVEGFEKVVATELRR